MPCFAFNPTGHWNGTRSCPACCAWDIAKVRWWKFPANSASAEASSTFTRRPIPIRCGWSFSATPSNPSVFSIRPPKSRPTRSSRPGCYPARELIRPEDAPDALAPLTADAEWHAPSVYGAMDSLLDYFPQPPVLVLDQPDTLKAHTAECWQAIEEGYLRHEDRSDPNPYPTPDQLYLTWDQIRAATERYATLALEPLTAPDASWEPVMTCPAQTPASVGLGQRGTAFSHTLEVLDQLREGGPVVLVARSQGQVGRLLALFGEHDRPAVEWKPSALAAGGAQKAPFSVLNGDVSAGFLSSELRLVVLTEEELFAKGPPQAATQEQGGDLSFLVRGSERR